MVLSCLIIRIGPTLNNFSWPETAAIPLHSCSTPIHCSKPDSFFFCTEVAHLTGLALCPCTEASGPIRCLTFLSHRSIWLNEEALLFLSCLKKPYTYGSLKGREIWCPLLVDEQHSFCTPPLTPVCLLCVSCVSPASLLLSFLPSLLCYPYFAPCYAQNRCVVLSSANP